MTSFLQFNLVSHIFLGVLGVVLLYVVWFGLLKQEPAIKFLSIASLAGFIFIFMSWLTGGYYYTVFYGKAVKPIIKAGEYPWAHGVFTEAKEHLFIFLPFLILVIYAVILYARDEFQAQPELKKPLVYVAGLTFILGLIITFSGMIISGAVR